tara:strand:- start:9003 stop:9995 length:993 start_codon:yes stop_codon:yes gene_type:complete
MQAVIKAKIAEDVTNQAVIARNTGTTFSSSGLTSADDIDLMAMRSAKNWGLDPTADEALAMQYASTGGLVDVNREGFGEGRPNNISEELWNAVDAYGRPARLALDVTTGEYRIATPDDIAALSGANTDFSEDVSSETISTDAPQLGALPTFASQAEIDQDRYDSTSAAGRALMAGQSLPKFSMATSPGTARFFGNQSEMAVPTMQTLMGMTPNEQANYSAAARMFQKPEFGDLARISQERWGGRRTAPTATMGGMAGGFSGFGGFNQGSSIMPPRASRPTRSTSATFQSPFGFQAQGRGGVKRAAFNRPSRLRASSIRSGRDGMIRGRGA